MLIRYATLDDLDLIAPLFAAYRVFYEQAHDLPAARRFIGDRLRLRESVILLALDEKCGTNEALGFVQMYPAFSSVACQGILLLNDLFVAQTARRQGVARQLLERAKEHGLSVGAAKLKLSTANTNQLAQKLYESLGYQQDQAFRHYSLAI
ncbi:GNAT family N-acetyltransferase [Chitinibacter sp. FCG-7]|uniref:GNAT family N-acetyltransferase n=1 Tax=Chitinibacter mangrovi TaxID=3153927 RepID=A0AAU7FDF8_9NEIS